MTASNQQLYQRVKAQFERYVGTDDCLDLAPVREVTDEIEWLTRERNQAVKTSQEIREDFLDLMRVIQRYQPPGSPPPGGGVAVAKWVLETLSTRPAVEIERLRAELADLDEAWADNERLRAALESVPCSCDARENPEWEHDKMCAVAIADKALRAADETEKRDG